MIKCVLSDDLWLRQASLLQMFQGYFQADLLSLNPISHSYYNVIESFGIRSVVVGDTRGTSREKAPAVVA